MINLTHPNKAPVDGDRVRIEHDNGAVEEFYFHAPDVVETPPETFLHIFYPKYAVIGDTVTMHISVKFADGALVPVNATYRVPIMRDSDGKQVEYLKAVFTDGEASVSFTPTEAGKLVMDVTKIDPKPTATVVDWPVVFVDKP